MNDIDDEGSFGEILQDRNMLFQRAYGFYRVADRLELEYTQLQQEDDLGQMSSRSFDSTENHANVASYIQVNGQYRNQRHSNNRECLQKVEIGIPTRISNAIPHFA